MAFAGNDVVQYEKRNRKAYITLNRPEAMNAISTAVRQGLLQAMEDLRDDDDIDAVLMTGGTGLTSRDQTYETVTSLITKPLPGYGELFRMLSYQEIGAAAVLSRAFGGLIDQTVVLTMPGSTAAVRLAMEQLILPELAHLVSHARR